MDTKINTIHHENRAANKSPQDEAHVGFEAIDPVEEREVVAKLDTHVLPLMIFVYFCMCMSPNHHSKKLFCPGLLTHGKFRTDTD